MVIHQIGNKTLYNLIPMNPPSHYKLVNKFNNLLILLATSHLWSTKSSCSSLCHHDQPLHRLVVNVVMEVSVLRFEFARYIEVY